jgi:hypothetical protein
VRFDRSVCIKEIFVNFDAHFCWKIEQRARPKGRGHAVSAASNVGGDEYEVGKGELEKNEGIR